MKTNIKTLAALAEKALEEKADPPSCGVKHRLLDFRRECNPETILAIAKQQERLVEALKAAEMFIENGVEFGYIRMPDEDTPDTAHNTLPMIKAALAGALEDENE